MRIAAALSPGEFVDRACLRRRNGVVAAGIQPRCLRVGHRVIFPADRLGDGGASKIFRVYLGY